jgi:CcmD family protein
MMRMPALKSLWVWTAMVAVTLGASARSVLAFAAQQTAAQDVYVPVSQLPQQETIPAAPLVLIAYAFVWVALVAYVFTLWRRAGRLEREVAEIRQTLRTPAAR